MTINIATIEKEHIESFHAALDIVAREKKYLAFTQAPPLETTRTFVLDNIEHGYPQFVALDYDEVVGWCDISPMKNRPTMAHTGTLGIGILPAYRGQGLGRKLIEATIRKGRQQGLKRIELTVRENNENAIALYGKLGFEIEGLKRNAHFIDGHYEHVYMMALLS